MIKRQWQTSSSAIARINYSAMNQTSLSCWWQRHVADLRNKGLSLRGMVRVKGAFRLQPEAEFLSFRYLPVMGLSADFGVLLREQSG